MSVRPSGTVSPRISQALRPLWLNGTLRSIHICNDSKVLAGIQTLEPYLNNPIFERHTET
jgi:hypothetical protein